MSILENSLVIIRSGAEIKIIDYRNNPPAFYENILIIMSNNGMVNLENGMNNGNVLILENINMNCKIVFYKNNNSIPEKYNSYCEYIDAVNMNKEKAIKRALYVFCGSLLFGIVCGILLGNIIVAGMIIIGGLMTIIPIVQDN